MTGISDTDSAVVLRHRALLRELSPTERLERALALSAFVRELAWQGAAAHAGHLGHPAVVERFLQQLYGPQDGAGAAALLARAAVTAPEPHE